MRRDGDRRYVSLPQFARYVLTRKDPTASNLAFESRIMLLFVAVAKCISKLRNLDGSRRTSHTSAPQNVLASESGSEPVLLMNMWHKELNAVDQD